MLSQALNKPPSALETAQQGQLTDWLTQTSSPNFDITNVTGMSPYMNLYNRARTNDLSGNTPEPMAATWGGSPNTGLSQVLASQNSRQREQEAAGGLQQAYASKNAAMQGQTLPFLEYQQQGNLGLWNLLNNRSLTGESLYGRSITTPSTFQQYLMAAMKSAGDMASAAIGAGGGG